VRLPLAGAVSHPGFCLSLILTITKPSATQSRSPLAEDSGVALLTAKAGGSRLTTALVTTVTDSPLQLGLLKSDVSYNSEIIESGAAFGYRLKRRAVQREPCA